jgi:hypothetical protein
VRVMVEDVMVNTPVVSGNGAASRRASSAFYTRTAASCRKRRRHRRSVQDTAVPQTLYAIA